MLQGIIVFINTDQTAGRQAGRDFIRMPPEAESTVQVKPVRPDGKPVKTFLQEDGNMLPLIHQKPSSCITAAMFSALFSAPQTASHWSGSQSSA